MSAFPLSLVQLGALGGFLFVVHRAFTLTNFPLLESDPKPRESHKWRLITAAFYVPFVPAAAIFFPLVFKCFLSLMIYIAVQEYLQVLFQLPTRYERATTRRRNSEAKKKERFAAYTKKIQLAGLLVSFSAFPGTHPCHSLVINITNKFLTELDHFFDMHSTFP